MADENKGPSNQPEVPTAAVLTKAAGAVLAAVEHLPRDHQRQVLRSAHTLLGLDAAQPVQRTQQRPQNTSNNDRSQQRGGRG